MRRVAIALLLVVLLVPAGVAGSTTMHASSDECRAPLFLATLDCGETSVDALVSPRACRFEFGAVRCAFDVEIVVRGRAPTEARLAAEIGDGFLAAEHWGVEIYPVCETTVRDEGSCSASDVLDVTIRDDADQFLLVGAFLHTGPSFYPLTSVWAETCAWIGGAAIGAVPTLTTGPCP